MSDPCPCGRAPCACGVSKPALRLSLLVAREPLRVLGLAKAAALKANWSLAQWVEFSTTARAELGPAASQEELDLFHDVVAQWFDVTISEPRASGSPASPTPPGAGPVLVAVPTEHHHDDTD